MIYSSKIFTTHTGICDDHCVHILQYWPTCHHTDLQVTSYKLKCRQLCTSNCVVLDNYKGWSKKNVPGQNLKMAFWQEPFVRGGCPSHSLEYSWVHLTVRRTASSDKRFLSKGHFQILTGDIFFDHPLYILKPNQDM